jgi:hypothetical protein
MKVELMIVDWPVSEREEVDILIKECCDPEDDDGFIPYERTYQPNSQKIKLKSILKIQLQLMFALFCALERTLKVIIGQSTIADI